MRFPEHHNEVVEAIKLFGNLERGIAVKKDRGSQLDYLGASFPIIRSRVKEGFSFTKGDSQSILEIWDDLWKFSPWGDVLFAALEYYVPISRRKPSSQLWAVTSNWIDRVDNWCHSDQLSRLYSHLLEHDFDSVYPQLVEWNGSANLWQKRSSIVALIHYSGKNAVFLRPEQMLPLVRNCVSDERHYIQTAVGWVLREVGHVYPDEVTRFIEPQALSMTSTSFNRAIERLPVDTAKRLQALRSFDKSSRR